MDELTDARQVSSILSPGITLFFYNFLPCSLEIVYGFLLSIFFQVEEGRLVEDEKVTEIIINMSTKLKAALADEVAAKKPNILTLAASLKSFRTTKYGQPVLFNSICIFTEGCIPELKASFLATHDSKFARVVARPIVYPIFSSVVRDVFKVPVVPEVVLV